MASNSTPDASRLDDSLRARFVSAEAGLVALTKAVNDKDSADFASSMKALSKLMWQHASAGGA